MPPINKAAHDPMHTYSKEHKLTVLLVEYSRLTHFPVKSCDCIRISRLSVTQANESSRVFMPSKEC